MITKKLFFQITLCLATFTSVEAQNIGINKAGSKPDKSAVLDLNTGNNGTLGFLAPQVALIATNIALPVTSPATGLIVYNTATSGVVPFNVTPGYYYWNVTAWTVFSSGGSGSVGPTGPTGNTGATGPTGPTGNSSNAWLLLGNAGTVDGTNFIGTTDNIPLTIKVDNKNAGRIEN